VIVSPSGLMGINSFGTWALKTKRKFAVYRSRLSSLMVSGGVVDHVEVHACAIGRGLQLFERRLFLHQYRFPRRGVREEFPDNIRLAVLVQNPFASLPSRKLKRLREIRSESCNGSADKRACKN